MIESRRDSPRATGMFSGANISAEPPFEAIYRENYAFVWRTLRCLGVVDSALDDAAQDVFLVVHRRLGEFEGRASLRTWIYEITRRVAARYRTRASTDAARTFELPELRSSDDLDVAVDQAMAAELLRAFLDQLDEDRQRVFVLSELWQMRGREIAEALDVNMNTVYARLRSARTDLDRVARRLHARDVGTLTRAIRKARPPREREARTWSLLVAKLGLDTATAAGSMLPWVAQLKWALVGGAAGVALVAGLAASAPAGSTGTALTEAVPPREAAPHTGASDLGATGREVARGDTAPHLDASAPGATRPETARGETAPRVDAPPTHAGSPAEGRPTALPFVVAETGPEVAPPGRRPADPVLATDTAATADPSLSAEVALVRGLRALVAASDRPRTEREIARYRARFPDGTLRPEVDALEIELACRTDSVQGARMLQSFERRWPDSRLQDRLEKICRPKVGSRNLEPTETQPL
jgi:RNA polymerase sigma-70 factor, ECF subfamily